jgi:pre-mRNA-splicing factor 38A
MANVTDPLIRGIQGSDPQNLMEYITRQKIYDSRFWKEECFGLAAVDVLEKAAKIKTIGGLPTKFLALTLKLLQLQPEPEDIIESFIQQEDFKYVRALGALYLRLTGRPQDIYDELEALYRDYRKLRIRRWSDWSLIHMDEFIHQLMTEVDVCGITLPRLPKRETLQENGYIDDGPRPTALREVLEDAGGPLEFLKQKVEQNSQPAIALWEERTGKKIQREGEDGEEDDKKTKKRKKQDAEHSKDDNKSDVEEGELSSDAAEKPSKKKKKKKKRNYDNLFKDSKSKASKPSKGEDKDVDTAKAAFAEGSDEYWNEQRAKLGLKALK